MKIAVVGGRKFSNYNLLKETLEQENYIGILISGGAKGADQMAERYALEKNLPTLILRPLWDLHGKKAGFIRNKEIVEACDKLIAFWDGQSKGTSHSIYLARSLGKEVKVINYAN